MVGLALLGVLALLVGATHGRGAANAGAATWAGVQAGPDAVLTVRVIVDFGDGMQKHYTAIPWKKGMTALDAMVAAREHAHGTAFSHRGEGETAFLDEIDGVKNQGAAGDGRNWQYWVNTEFGDRSFGVAGLAPGDVLLWRFDVWRGRP